MVTHEVDLVKQYNKRIITIKNGTVISDTAHPEIVVEDIPERVETAPTAYYEAPLEDDDIERFIQNYGKNTEESVNTEESAASEKSESSDSI